MGRCFDCIHCDACDVDRHEKERMYGDCSDFLHDNDVVPKEEVEKIFEEIDSTIELVCAMTGVNITIFGKYAELKKKYIGDKR